MKTFFLLILVSTVFYTNTHAGIFFPDHKIKDPGTATVMAYLKETDANLQIPDVSLHLSHYKKALASRHFTFDILYKNVPVLNAFIKVSTDLNGNILCINRSEIEWSKLEQVNLEDQSNRWANQDMSVLFAQTPNVKTFELKIDMRNDITELVAVIECYDQTTDFTYVFDRNLQLLDRWNNSRYLKTDTIIHAKVFRPDPLTSQGLSYGAPYIDDNDNALPWFDPAYFQADIAAVFETADNTFYLENDWVVIDDFDSPFIAPATSATPDFFFNRSQSGFEDVNALYHITCMHNHISSLGYDTLMDDIITVDTHGMFGGDNSVFNRNGGSPTLSFGTGGIDDAEDADVIVHEYSHALSWSANGNDNFNTGRSGLDEGLADYFATSYSRAIDPFNWQKVFSWDGNTAAWNGRTATTPNNYPGGQNIYAIGEIWNAAMSAIWTDLGQIVTDKLMLESMHFFTNTTPLSEAAVYVLMSDTILFGGIHSTTICNHFQNKNILTASCSPSATGEILKDNTGIQVKNTYGFAFRNEAIEICFDEWSSGSYTVYGMPGNKLLHQDFKNTKNVLLFPETLAAGVYLLKVQCGDKTLCVRISK